MLPYSLGLPRWEENAPHQESFTTSDGRHLARPRVAFSVLSAQDGLFQESVLALPSWHRPCIFSRPVSNLFRIEVNQP